MIISRTKRAFEVKQKTFVLTSQVLSFRHKKQTSKNVADTTFKTLSQTSEKDPFWNMCEWKKVPHSVACPIGKMSSQQPNNNDKLLCTKYWANPGITHRTGIYGAQGHGKIILN